MESDVTLLLERVSRGDQGAYHTLLPLVYDRLRLLASTYMRQEREDHTLQATALIHEACLRIFQFGEMQMESRQHFLHIAARAMRRVLVDHARARNRQKRGPDVPRVPLDEVAEEIGTSFGCPDLDILALNEALDRLEAQYPRQARVVELLFFAGHSRPEVAEILSISLKTVDRDWAFARAWLLRESAPPSTFDLSSNG